MDPSVYIPAYLERTYLPNHIALLFQFINRITQIGRAHV